MKNAQLPLFKKEFAKAIKMIRSWDFCDGEYPKAMMTSYQMLKQTATVNCGKEGEDKDRTKTVAEKVLYDREFTALCAYYKVNAFMEYNKVKHAWQVRLNW